jgi:methyltransferase (TIGR00027 family)
MKNGKASQTADMVTALRALESFKPEDERVCYDPLAKSFLGGAFALFARNKLLTRIALWNAERRRPGAMGVASYIAVRTRHIDECLKESLRNGIQQVVILGAGYDSRAYRFDDLKARVRIFEVDHPATQKMKKHKLHKIFGQLPGHVVYVSVDFVTQKFGERLLEHGYDTSLKTLFIWEGVTYYITAEAVDETLAFVAENSGEGSRIIFDYAPKALLDGKWDPEAARGYNPEFLKKKGEPWTFGIEDGTIDDFLSQRGYGDVANAPSELLKRVYFKGVNKGREMSRIFRIATATVAPRVQTQEMPARTEAAAVGAGSK